MSGIANIAAVIFDLDGVLVHTDHYHYLAWKRICDEEGITFDETVNHRLRGVSRTESLEIILEQTEHTYSQEMKLQLAERKNGYYKELLHSLSHSDTAVGVLETIGFLQKNRIRMAIGSSSKNAPLILEKLGLLDKFDAVADGNSIRNSKPDPEVFLIAAGRLGVEPELCLVVEDAASGIIAARRAGMKVVAVGQACMEEQADFHIHDMSEFISLLSDR
ncbi:MULTISPECIES: beta-phosphoglucomutase [unclassified Paenibacillus]|uniref:beta-phosphoglucomutase n=1 Tax=unclassified Paenibacillus TaxID=185978 RepID=UPI00363C1308